MRSLIFYISIGLLVSCGGTTEKEDPNDPILASVYDQSLKLSDVKPLLQTESSPEDSTLYANSIIEKWVREAILMHEAERNIPADLDIQKMVNDYRSSLILMTYKQQLVEQKLDTTVTQAQLENYYEEHKNQYVLDEPILKCILYKVDKNNESFEEVDDLWKNKKFDDLTFLNQEVYDLKLSSDEWYTWKDVKALIPRNFWSYNNIKDKNPRSKSSGNFKYYIKVEAYEDKNKNAPLSYIQDQATKVILHKRQTELLDDLMENLYDKYASNSNVKINI